MEYVFVDDASTDSSMEVVQTVLDRHPDRRPQVKLIRLETNGGVSNARRVGMANVSGEYVIHADSDDWVDLHLYEQLYEKALACGADIVGCDIRHEYDGWQQDFVQHYADTVDENISRLINGTLFPSLCTSLTKTSIIRDNHITFPEGLNMGEDLFYNLQLYLCATKIAHTGTAVYHYRHTEASSSLRPTRQAIDSSIMIGRRIEQLLREKQLYDRYKKDLDYRQFTLKLPLVKDFNRQCDYQTWRQLFPETNRHIWSYSRLNRLLRLQLWLAAHHLTPLAILIKSTLEWQYAMKNQTDK